VLALCWQCRPVHWQQGQGGSMNAQISWLNPSCTWKPVPLTPVKEVAGP
jgi:hypothetical protein